MSISKIGKIIKRYDLTFNPSKLNYHNPDSGWANRKKSYKSRIRHSPNYNKPGYLEIDTIVKFIYEMKLYIYNAVDLNTRWEFSYGFRSSSSRIAVESMKKLESVFPYEGGIHIVETVILCNR